jgi:polyvinyl alcohol dehydrogenase (cytochrome)
VLTVEVRLPSRNPARAMRILLLAMLLLVLLPGAALADWPIYGHDLQNTRTAASEGPTRDQLASLEQAWSFSSETGDFTGTPVVAGGVLVAGDHGGWVYALDAVTGKQLWKQDLGAEINGTAAIDPNAPGGAAVYVPVAQIGGPRLVALALKDGAKRWDTTLSKQDGASVYGSPVYWKGTLYIGTSGPNNDDATARGSVVALDQASGAIRWQTFTVPEGSDGAAVWVTPAIDTATGRLYVGTGNNYHEPTTDMADSMLALDATSGAILAHYQATPDDSFSADNLFAGPDYDFGASPNLFDGPDGQRLVGEGQKSGTYWALDRATMKPVWSQSIGAGGYLGGIIGSTAFDGTRVYGADALDGHVFALGRDGLPAWTSQDTGQAHFGPTMVARGVLYTIDPSGFVVARDPATGAEITRLSLGAPAFGGASAVGGALYVSVGTGPPPAPAPQQDGTGSIVAFGDTSRSGAGKPGGKPPRGSRRAKRLRLVVRPRRVRAGRPVVLRFRVVRTAPRPAGAFRAAGASRAATASRGVPHARIRFAGRTIVTGRRGKARLRVRFRHPALRRAWARKAGFVAARAKVRVVSR